MKILPPIKPCRVLDMGCGEGKDAVFFAKCGYLVTAFDISEQGIENSYRPETEYDIIFSSGVLHFLPESQRREICDSLKDHTADNGINAMNVFVKKPFITRAPDSTRDEEKRLPWHILGGRKVQWQDLHKIPLSRKWFLLTNKCSCAIV